ncbi:MAG: guanylate cyclase [Eggerthellaceae bacterium]|nr:guanylate cyclase [Eggerthellaceae bacterium]
MVVRLVRSIPLLIILAVLAVVIYFVVSYKRSPAHAKELLIKLFTWITSIISGFFLLVTLYALFEGNDGVLDLGVVFLITGLIGLGVVQICRWRFRKNNPRFAKPANTTATNATKFTGFFGGK